MYLLTNNLCNLVFHKYRLSKQSIINALINLLILIGLTTSMTANAQSAEQITKPVSAAKTTLVIASHPYPNKSVINKALQQVAENTQGVTVRNLETLYGNNLTGFDIQAERNAYEGVDRVVLLFPIHWFSVTPMLKAYFNEVWTGWAPNALKGKELLVVTTAGANAQMYSREGKIHKTIEEVLTPLEASANYAGMKYLPPLAFLGVSGADNNMIRQYQQAFSERLIDIK